MIDIALLDEVHIFPIIISAFSMAVQGGKPHDH